MSTQSYSSGKVAKAIITQLFNEDAVRYKYELVKATNDKSLGSFIDPIEPVDRSAIIFKKAHKFKRAAGGRHSLSTSRTQPDC
jgi:hypothetical protein